MPVSYDSLRQLPIVSSLGNQINRLFCPGMDGPRQDRTCNGRATQDRRALQPHSFYNRQKPRQEQLTRILAVLAAWNPQLGYSCHFARLAAVILPAVYHEKAAFKVSMMLFSRWRAHEYYIGDRSGLCKDVQQVFASVRMLWKEVLMMFEQYQCEGLLSELVQGWLLTFLGAACNTEYQSFSEFSPLLNSLIMAEKNTSDPRHMIRYIVVCITGRNRRVFTTASSRLELMHRCRSMRQHVPVDSALMQLVDSRTSMEQCMLLDRTTLVPTGLAAGWLSGFHVSSCLVAPAVGFLTHCPTCVYLAATLGGLAGCLAGAGTAFVAGGILGMRFANFAMVQLISIAENEQLQTEEERANSSNTRTAE